MSFTLRDFQIKLQSKGFYTGEADGLYGPLTKKAVDAWGPSGSDLDAPIRPPEPGTLIPPAWLVPCQMSRVVVHWTAGGPDVSAIDREHYHIIIDQSNNLARGDHSISDNVNTGDDDYAAHTLGCNTGAIGISLCGMVNAVERPFRSGPAPIKQAQWETAARVVAELLKFYKIPLTEKTVLQHGEVQKTLGIAQRGKWDCMVLPWDLKVTPAQAGQLFRTEVRKHL